VTKQQVEGVSGPTWAGTIFTKTTHSMQVSWWDCHVFMTEMARQANCGPVPWPGTASWCELADGDPRKLLALAEFGVHHALRVETAQQAECEASHAISAAENWSRVAQSNLQRANVIRSGAYIPRRSAS
jgi:Protein of unknown function (DUF2742)